MPNHSIACKEGGVWDPKGGGNNVNSDSRELMFQDPLSTEAPGPAKSREGFRKRKKQSPQKVCSTGSAGKLKEISCVQEKGNSRREKK